MESSQDVLGELDGGEVDSQSDPQVAGHICSTIFDLHLFAVLNLAAQLHDLCIPFTIKVLLESEQNESEVGLDEDSGLDSLVGILLGMLLGIEDKIEVGSLLGNSLGFTLGNAERLGNTLGNLLASSVPKLYLTPPLNIT